MPLYLYKFVSFSQVEPESFVTKPIIFGDFIKVGAQKEDRVYEDYSDMLVVISCQVVGSDSLLLLLYRCFIRRSVARIFSPRFTFV